MGEDYLPDWFAIDELLAFADVSGDGEVGATDYLIAYATLYEKEISECLTNGISLKTTMQAADINGDGAITESDKDIGIDYALNGSSTYPIGEEVDNTSTCNVAENNSTVTAQYAYNPSGLRKSKTVGGSTKYFVYNGSQIVFEYDDLGEGTVYYYGLNRTHNSDGEIYVYNAHGDTVQLVNNNAVVVSYTYGAFGNLTSQAGESDNPFLYCSEYFDEETGTYHLRARYYNPANGRFTQEDPIRDGLNWYTYCSCNPVMYTDPSGLKPPREESAALASHIYGDYDVNTSSVDDRTVAGWTLIDIYDDIPGCSIKVGVYIPENDDPENPTEYALVFRGSTTNFEDLETWQVWINNVQAFTSKTSLDMYAAIAIGIWFDATHTQEITFIGHSKGGGEAIAAATATGNNAITFNAANFDFAQYGLIETNKFRVVNYYITGEILSSLILPSRYGITIPVLSPYWNEYNVFGVDIRVVDPLKSHSINSFIDAWGVEM